MRGSGGWRSRRVRGVRRLEVQKGEGVRRLEVQKGEGGVSQVIYIWDVNQRFHGLHRNAGLPVELLLCPGSDSLVMMTSHWLSCDVLLLSFQKTYHVTSIFYYTVSDRVI